MKQQRRKGFPFGKWKGFPVSVVRQDRQYCDWLCSQPWFGERFPALLRRLQASPVTATGKVIPWEQIRDRFERRTDADTQEAACAG